jgi:hypothetical protein
MHAVAGSVPSRDARAWLQGDRRRRAERRAAGDASESDRRRSLRVRRAGARHHIMQHTCMSKPISYITCVNL